MTIPTPLLPFPLLRLKVKVRGFYRGVRGKQTHFIYETTITWSIQSYDAGYDSEVKKTNSF